MKLYKLLHHNKAKSAIAVHLKGLKNCNSNDKTLNHFGYD